MKSPHLNLWEHKVTFELLVVSNQQSKIIQLKQILTFEKEQ